LYAPAVSQPHGYFGGRHDAINGALNHALDEFFPADVAETTRKAGPGIAIPGSGHWLKNFYLSNGLERSAGAAN
jgi:hypothetical protein